MNEFLLFWLSISVVLIPLFMLLRVVSAMNKLEGCKVVDVNIDHEAITLTHVNRIEALEAALKEAHRVILHELDSGRTPYLLPVDNGGKGLGYFEDVLAGIER